MNDQQNSQFNQQDASEQTGGGAQPGQAGYGNNDGLDDQARTSIAGVTGEDDGSELGQSGMGDQSGSGDYGGQTGTSGQGGSGITGGMGGPDGMTGSAAGASDDATESLIDDDDDDFDDAGLDDDDSSLQSDMGDGLGSQSAAGAGSSGTGQTS